jgi:hypothetical protein
VDVEVQGLHQPLHSGYSGPVPDPVQILCAMIADLRKPNGALNVTGLYAKVARPSAKQLARIRTLLLSEAKFKKDSGMLPGVRLWGESQFSLLERMWTRPALTVIALEARPFLGSSNQIIEAARPRLSLRTIPGMDAREAGRLIVKKLTTKPPYGVKVTAKINGTTPWWTTDPEGPAFEAARGALSEVVQVRVSAGSETSRDKVGDGRGCRKAQLSGDRCRAPRAGGGVKGRREATSGASTPLTPPNAGGIDPADHRQRESDPIAFRPHGAPAA